MNGYVIIGNGPAAIGCIEGIRSRDTEGQITVVSGEPYEAYGRPLISYYLQGKTDPERMRYREPDFYERMRCRVLFGRRAVQICPSEQKAVLDDGTSLSYDGLCVAAGSSPFIPPFDGLEMIRKRYSFMTLDDAKALDQAVAASSRVLIIGAGLIGLKCAEGLAGRVASLTVCDLADRVLSSILDSDCAVRIQRRMEENGIRFRLGDSVLGFEKGRSGSRARMKSGDCEEFDILVLAVGVRPDIALVREAGGETDRGILVDRHMATSLPGIWAAGDCTEGPDAASGQRRILAILPNAVMQGRTAGVNMAGGDAVFDKGIPMNSIGLFGLHVMTAGAYDGELYEEKTDRYVKRLYTKEDRLTGFILIGCEERAGIYTAMIRERTPLSSVDFEMMKKMASVAAYSPEIRRKKFESVV